MIGDFAFKPANETDSSNMSSNPSSMPSINDEDVASRFENAFKRMLSKADTPELRAEFADRAAREALRTSEAVRAEHDVSTGIDGCPLAFGEDENGAPAGPWFEATEVQAAAADAQDATRHKVINPKTGVRDADLRTTSGKRCIRDKPEIAPTTDAEDFAKGVLEKLRLMANVLDTSVGAKQRRRGQINVEMNRMQEHLSKLKAKDKFGPRLDFKPDDEKRCDSLGKVDNMWKNIVGTPQHPKVPGLKATPEELAQNRWMRGFEVALDGERVRCLNGMDSLIDELSKQDHHHLAELRDIYTKDDDGSYPHDGDSKMSLEKAYAISALCAQRPTKSTCESTAEAPVMGSGDNLKPADVCSFYPGASEAGTEGICRPKFIAGAYKEGVSPAGGLPSNAMGKFYAAFHKAERDIQARLVASKRVASGGGTSNRWRNASTNRDVLTELVAAAK